MGHHLLPIRSKKHLILILRGSRGLRGLRERSVWALRLSRRRKSLDQRKSHLTKSMSATFQTSTAPSRDLPSQSPPKLRLRWIWLAHFQRTYWDHPQWLTRAKVRASTLNTLTTRRKSLVNINNSRTSKDRLCCQMSQLWPLSTNSRSSWERITRIELNIKSLLQVGTL